MGRKMEIQQDWEGTENVFLFFGLLIQRKDFNSEVIIAKLDKSNRSPRYESWICFPLRVA